ncbi:MAG: hypothetical protein CTY29_09830 [Methylobacter sp.]|nr:MAG: hypothetical protein CTY29_09830 [Methylobacter sp.]
MKNSFYLVIPAQQNNPARLKQFEEKALQHWIAQLPTANPSLASRLMHDFIIEFNALEMEPQNRFVALEALRPSVQLLEEYLRSRFIKTGFPKEENEKKIFEVLIAIERHYTIGYWTVLKQVSQRPSGWFQGKNTALVIQRCIKGLGRIVASHLMMGVVVPDWVWIDLHSLYRLSCKLKKDSSGLIGNLVHISKVETPEECYIRILLLSLADPTGLMQKEIGLVYRFIKSITHLAVIKQQPVSHQDRQCVILADEDRPPYFLPETATAPDSATLYLDLTRLHKAFEHKAKWVNAAESRFYAIKGQKIAEDKLPAELLDYLEQRWAGIGLEGVALFADRLDRYIAVGLEPTHELQSMSSGKPAKNTEFLVQSASERLLSCLFEKTGVISVGSLVSFRKADVPEHRRVLGIVNKIVVAKQYGINFGIQLLAPFTLAVTYLPLNMGEQDSQQKALLFSAKEQNTEKSYLIVDNFMLKDEDILRLFMPRENFPVILGNKKNIGLGYWQFECRRLAEKAKTEPEKKGYDFM